MIAPRGFQSNHFRGLPAPGNAPGKLPLSKQGPLGLGSVCPRARETAAPERIAAPCDP